MEKRRKMLIIGIIGCVCFMIGDELWMYVGRGQTTENLGLILDSRWLAMPYWRFAASIFLGAVGTPLFYLGYREMHGMILEYAKTKADRRWAKMFQIGYLGGTMYCTYAHAFFMVLAIVVKGVYEASGNLDAAVTAAEKVERSLDRPVFNLRKVEHR